MIVTFYNIRQWLDDLDNFPIRYIQGSKKRWSLRQTVTIQLSNNHVITIPKGFEWDLSSSPWYMWWAFPPFGDFLFAALIHDWLYVHNLFGRHFADTEMLRWSGFVCDNNTDNYIRYRAVQQGGSSWWQKATRRINLERAEERYIEPVVIAPAMVLS